MTVTRLNYNATLRHKKTTRAKFRRCPMGERKHTVQKKQQNSGAATVIYTHLTTQVISHYIHQLLDYGTTVHSLT